MPASPDLPEPETYTGLSPAALWLDGSRYEAARWWAILQAACTLMAAEAGPRFAESVTHIRGRTRPYFSAQPDDLFRAVSIENSDLFVEGNLSANLCVRLARRVVVAVRGNDDGFRIELAE